MLSSINNLATLYHRQDRLSEAEPLYLRALTGREHVFGRDHPETLNSVHNLAWLYSVQGRYSDSELLFQRGLEGYGRVLGEEHPLTVGSLDGLATLHFTQSDWAGAASFWRQTTSTLSKRSLHTTQGADEISGAKNKNQTWRFGWQFVNLVKAVSRLGGERRTPDAAAFRETFQAAQWALGSEAAQSLAQMAARGAKGDPKLAGLVRERQVLVVEWQRRDKLRIASLGQASDQRDDKVEAENAVGFTAINARVTEIDQQLTASFPDYAAMISPEPLSLQAVQAQLAPMKRWFHSSIQRK